jgi:5-methylcytosine-specific restriction endonuclease McrA
MGQCLCGCGTEVSNFYARGHNPTTHKTIFFEPRLCACGCGTEIIPKWGYDSKFVSGHNMINFPHDEIWNDNVSKAKRNKKVPKLSIAKTNVPRPDMDGDSNIAKRPEVRIKISKKLKGRDAWWTKGPNAWNWIEDRDKANGGYDDLFKVNSPIVRKKAKGICQKCGKPGITVHHINHNKKDSRMENLINLCGGCNKSVEGKKLKEFWEMYFKMINGTFDSSFWNWI